MTPKARSFPRKTLLTLLLSCLITYLLGAFPAISDSYVFNELGRLASGLTYIKNQDFSLFNVNPPLSNVVAALPAAMIPNVYCPTRYDYGFSPTIRHEYDAGRILLEKNPNCRLLVVAGRFCVLLFSAFGLFVVFTYSNWLFGRAGGFLAALLWVFSPYILGHGTHIGPDVPSAATAIATSASFHYALAKRSERWLIRAGILLGIAELTKFTLILLYPILLTLWVFYRTREWSKQRLETTFVEIRKTLLMTFALSLLVLNAGYLFKGTFKPLKEYQFRSNLFVGESLREGTSKVKNRFKNSWLGNIPIPLPNSYLEGIDVQRVDFEKGLGGNSYLCGQYRQHGWFCYYFFALLIKTPIGFLALFVVAIALMASQKRFRLEWRDETFLWVPAGALLLFVSSQSGFSIHSRYAIPALPFLFITVGRVGRAFQPSNQDSDRPRRQSVKTLVLTLTTAGILGTLLVYPREISYFNLLTNFIPSSAPNLQTPVASSLTEKTVDVVNRSSREGARFLLDSNIDWGQDGYLLRGFFQKRPEIREIYLNLVGSVPLDEFHVKTRIYQPRVTPGWYAFSVNCLLGKDGEFSDFLRLRPTAILGATIYLYHVDEKEAEALAFHRVEEKE